ncbi:hypothetical protein L9F63_004056 [Diploptera punctata]|uniref:Gustatory receptor n=1 Tax=Diploptera punctata TaxID=6984 RepID=A0AAD7ZGH6_DIPPU|nr:hypothetical protein L9F63_004056 [Diploptera punctata]
MGKQTFDSIYMISLQSLWIIKFSFKLMSITASCQSVYNEVDRTTVLVQKLLLLQGFEHETLKEIDRFSQQLLHRKIKFVALWFFDLDLSVLFTIIGGVTTYLVIVMQFKD